jgi:hypothetical protein
VVEHPNAVKAGRLGELHSFDQFGPEELMLGDV